MTTDPLVTVVIPTFNNRLLIELCLRSMRCCTDRPFRVIIRDNGSTDGTVEFLESSGLVHLVLKSAANDFDNVEQATYDEAIRNHVRTPYFLVCHSDMIFLQPDWIEDIQTSLGDDDANILGGRIIPSSFSGGWIFGRWLSPWYAWGRTEAFKELNLSWRRQRSEWCVRYSSAVRAYFDEELIARNQSVSLFWEHGGYLLALVDHHRRRIVDRQFPGVFHIGDMTGSFIKGTHFPDAPDVGRRVGRAAAIEQLIQRILATQYESNQDFLLACRTVAAFALKNDLAILKQFRA
jgi:glycosyltransferase involved in cell wall biosynthesis